MALQRAKKEDIPKDAILLSEDEALEHQWSIIEDHPDDWML